MAVHYTRERSKYGTLTGSIIAWPVEVASATNPNNLQNKQKLPAGYLRCDGTKYNAGDYPLLAEICGTGPTCKFAKFDENNELIGTIGEDEFVVPDLGSKYPKPVSGGDAGTFNNILTENQNGLFIERSGIGVEATSNVGSIAEVTYSGSFILPPQIIAVKGKPSWEWGNALGRTDEEAVEKNMIHPHMHFSNTSRVRLKSKGGATGGVVQIGGVLLDVTDSSLNPNYNGTAFVSYGSGSTEVGGFASPGFGSGYVAFGGLYSNSLVINREYTVTIDNTAGYTLMAVTAIVGNDNNGGERVNNVGEGIYIVWPGGETSASPIIPSRQESGLSQSQYDSQYSSWVTSTLPIPEAYRGTVMTITFKQTVVSSGGDASNDGTELQEPWFSDLGTYANSVDMCGVVQIGLTGGFADDPNLIDDGNDTPIGTNYFLTSSTIDVTQWLDNTKASGPSNNSPGSGQPACWAIASGALAGSEIQDQNLNLVFPVVVNEVIQRFNFCNTGCSLSTLRCYCLLKDSVSYELEKDWFGITGTRFSDYADSLGFCGPDPFGPGVNVPWDKDGVAPATYNLGSTGVPVDWKGSSLDDVLPINSLVEEEEVFPQVRNVYSTLEEYPTNAAEDPTIHDHDIDVVRDDHQFEIVTDAVLVDPENLNTTLALNPSSVASIDSATAPFIVVEYLIKT